MNYRESINLLSMRGAQLCCAEISGRKVNCIMLPVDDNHISVTIDPKTRQPNAAFLNLLADEPGNAYYDKVLRENPKATLPSHMLYVNPMPDARKRLELIREQQLRNDHDYMATNPTEEDIARRAKYDVRRTLYVGRAYSLGQQNEFRGTAPQATTTAYQPTGQEYTPQPQSPQQQPQQGYATQQPYQRPTSNVNPGDDLPF